MFTIPPKKEGFWKSFDDPYFPVPVSNLSKVNEDFLKKLKFIQENSKNSNSKIKVDQYYGFSECRLCDNRFNGTLEYSTSEFVWPEGYLHYLRDHNVHPSLAFFEYIMKY